MIKTRAYVVGNAVFAVSVIVLSALGHSSTHPLYLILLTVLCSAPLLYINKLNDRFALLNIFFLMYFMSFGTIDCFRLLGGEVDTLGSPNTADAVLDSAELAILLGGLCVQCAYLAACAVRRPAPGRAREWSEGLLVTSALAIWAVSTALTWRFKVYIIADASVDSVTHGLASLSGLEADEFMLATYLQPASLMMLAYGYCKYRRPYMLPIVILIVGVQFILGFIDDGKGEALSGVFLLIVARFLVDGRVPKVWLAAGMAVIVLAYPVLQANRAIRHQRDLSHAAAAANIGAAITQALDTAADKEGSTARASAKKTQSIFERTSLKDIVEVMFAKLGNGVEFRHGDTLKPLLSTFIPRSLWPEKPSLQLGLLVAKEFFPQESSDVNLSDSQLAELYWNFRWAGVIGGMLVIGCVLGLVGAACDLSQAVTLTRVLILGITIQLLVVGFESGIATQYSEWLRMMVAIGALHLVFAHERTSPPRIAAGTPGPLSPTPALASPRYPNLIR